MTVPAEEAPANSVPAAAVIRGGQALFGITGRKGRVGGWISQCENLELNSRPAIETAGWSVGEESGIPGVAVKCVDIGRNTGGEGGSLDHN